MKRLIKKSNIIRDENIGAHNGQSDNRLTMYNDNDELIGYLEYSVYADKPYINMIEVKQESKKQGIATELLRKLQSMFSGIEIDWGMMTDDGEV